jgi:hypothetical protein
VQNSLKRVSELVGPNLCVLKEELQNHQFRIRHHHTENALADLLRCVAGGVRMVTSGCDEVDRISRDVTTPALIHILGTMVLELSGYVVYVSQAALAVSH